MMEMESYFNGLMNGSRALNRSTVDYYVTELMSSTPNGPLVTSKLIANKISSQDTPQALLAFEFLELLLDSSESPTSDPLQMLTEFRSEICRYRFLNELIRLLSPKYNGNSTPIPIKERAVKFLLNSIHNSTKWFVSTENIMKITNVQSTLRDNGILIHKQENDANVGANVSSGKTSAGTTTATPSPFDDAQTASLLKKYLSSGDSNDLVRANNLIKKLLQEDNDRLNKKLAVEELLKSVQVSTDLLLEMIREFKKTTKTTNGTCSELEIMKELVFNINEYQHKLKTFIGDVTEEEVLNSLISANENINSSLALFNNIESEVAAAAEAELVPEMSLSDQLLLNLDLSFNEAEPVSAAEGSVRDENLLDFNQEDAKDEPLLVNQNDKLTQFNDVIGKMSKELMQTFISSSSNTSPSPLAPTIKSSVTTPSSLKNEDLSKTSNRVGEGGESLLEPYYLDLNYLETSTNTLRQASNHGENTCNWDRKGDNDKLLLDSSNSVSLSAGREFQLNKVKELDPKRIVTMDKLDPISWDLESNVIFKISFAHYQFNNSNHTKNLKAIITLLSNKSDLELMNYVFTVIPPAGIQVKLFPASSNEAGPWTKKYLPPPFISQIALLYNSNEKDDDSKSRNKSNQTTIKFILSYCIGDSETRLHNYQFQLPNY